MFGPPTTITFNWPVLIISAQIYVISGNTNLHCTASCCKQADEAPSCSLRSSHERGLVSRGQHYPALPCGVEVETRDDLEKTTGGQL